MVSTMCNSGKGKIREAIKKDKVFGRSLWGKRDV